MKNKLRKEIEEYLHNEPEDFVAADLLERCLRGMPDGYAKERCPLCAGWGLLWGGEGLRLSEWISVESGKRPPTDMMRDRGNWSQSFDMLVLFEDGDIGKGYYYDDDTVGDREHGWGRSSPRGDNYPKITHWMPLPEAPRED